MRLFTRHSIATLVALSMTLVTLPAVAQVPGTVAINLQIFDEDDPFGFSYMGSLMVELYDAPANGTLLWSEAHDSISIEHGFVYVPMGSVNVVTPLSQVLTENAASSLYVQLTLGNTAETLAERIPLASVPFAMVADSATDALSLGGHEAGDFALVGHAHATSDLSDWPDSFPPAAHEHGWADLTSGVPETFPPSAHSHSWEDLGGIPAWVDGLVVTWADIGDKPDEFPPSAHQHGWSDLVDLPDALEDGLVDWLEVVGKPLVFPPAAHSHDGVYLPVDGKATDSDSLDGLDSSFFALAADTYTKDELDSAVLAATGDLAAKVWCLEHCDPSRIKDCKDRTCDGGAETCEVGGALADGTLCQAQSGAGACQGGLCAAKGAVVCGDTVCPDLAGNYAVECNKKDFCEYANVLDSDWRKYDVWIFVPPGTFPMGSPDQEEGHTTKEAPVHDVTFAKGFFIMKYEVTVAQYEQCKAEGDCNVLKSYTSGISGKWNENTTGNGRADHPQNALCHTHAEEVCQWIAPDSRLPSEAEWEYAAKGPVHTKWVWGIDPPPSCAGDYAVYDEDGDHDTPWGCQSCESPAYCGTLPVGSKPNGASWCGAMDMAGNVQEWVAERLKDNNDSNYVGAPTDGSAWVDDAASTFVFRGGSYYDDYLDLRPAARGFYNSCLVTNGKAYGMPYRGTRCARPLE